MIEVRSITAYADESGQCRADEPEVMVALLTNGTRASEENLHQFAQQLHQTYGVGWKAQEWKRRDVVRLAALIRAKGWLLLRGYYKPPGDLSSPWTFIDYLKLCPFLEEETRAQLILEAEGIQPHIRIWLIALFDTVRGLHGRNQVAAGEWIFHERTAPTPLLLSYYLDYCLGAHKAEAWKYVHEKYRHVAVPELFRCRFRSDHEIDGLRVADYCAHFFRRTISPFGNEADVDMPGHELFVRVLETSDSHKAILTNYEDIQLWIDTVADLVELANSIGLDATRSQLAGDGYRTRVLEWLLKARFIV